MSELEANCTSGCDDDFGLDTLVEEHAESPPDPPLTREEIECALRIATCGFFGAKERWAERAACGMTDEALAEALRYEIGIFGGQCGPGMLGVSYQGSGLKLWADRRLGCYRGKPILAGVATVAMARAVYGIKDPSDRQMSLL